MGKIISIISLLCLPLLCFGQHEKVGLVFSGGGAKGLAHIGVLKALEENQIPIDYITGTSMGGVVGGFYAAGYSPEEIDSIATSDNFLQWISGEIPEQYKYYYLEPIQTPKWVEVNLGVDSTLEANFNPKLANDLSLNFELAEHMAPYQADGNSTDFDHLFVPFKAMGSEVFTQKQVLLDHGNLGASLRATMSVPFVYRPVKIDGQYIFDGGVYNNFPVEPMKEYYQPDVMIGVNVASKVYETYPAQEAERKISNSLLFMILDKGDPNKLGANGVYIAPNMENASGFDFNNARAIIDSGYQAAMRAMPTIKDRIVRRVTADSLSQARIAFKAKAHPLVFSDILLEGYNNKQQSYINKVLLPEHAGKLSNEDIKTNYYKLAAEPYFSDVFPKMSYSKKTESYQLSLSSDKEQKIGIQLGGNIASNNISNVYLGIRLDYLNRFLFNQYLAAQIGSFYKSFDYELRINLPLRKPMYLAPVYSFEKFNYDNINNFIFDKPLQNMVREKQLFGLKIGMPFNRKNKLLLNVLGFNHKDNIYDMAKYQLQDSSLTNHYYGGFTSLELSYNSLNQRIFPTAGKRYIVSIGYQVGETNVTEEVNTQAINQGFRLSANYQAYYPLSLGAIGFNLNAEVSTLKAFQNYGTTLMNTPVYLPTFESASRFLDNFRAPIFVAFGLTYQLPLFKNAALRTSLHGFKPFVTWEQNSNDIYWSNLTPEYRLAAMSALVYRTPVGPISLSAHYYEGGNPWAVLLNIGYLMFKERPLH